MGIRMKLFGSTVKNWFTPKPTMKIKVKYDTKSGKIPLQGEQIQTINGYALKPEQVKVKIKGGTTPEVEKTPQQKAAETRARNAEAKRKQQQAQAKQQNKQQRKDNKLNKRRNNFFRKENGQYVNKIDPNSKLAENLSRIGMSPDQMQFELDKLATKPAVVRWIKNIRPNDTTKLKKAMLSGDIKTLTKTTSELNKIAAKDQAVEDYIKTKGKIWPYVLAAMLLTMGSTEI